MSPARKIAIRNWLLFINKYKKLLVFLFFFSVFLLPQSAPVQAITPAEVTPYEFSSFGTNTQVFGITCMWRVSTIPGKKCWGEDPQTGAGILYENDIANGPLGIIGNGIAYLYSPPTSSTEYLANIGTNLGIVSPAYAQSVTGSGAGVIDPVLQIWQITRNIAYVGFILIFIAVGFMVMFRRKLNPQTVVTVQSALPGLAIGLILVTFSYFISAFIIDLCFVTMSLVGFVFQNAGPNILKDPQTLSQNVNIFDLFKLFILNPVHFEAVAGPISDVVKNVVPAGIVIPGTALGKGLGVVVGGLVMLVLLVALTIQMFRVFWALLQAYISILVSTILAPLVIMFASLPGRGAFLGFWWKNLLGNVLIFPAVFGVFLFAGTFLANTSTDQFKNTLPLFNIPDVGFLRMIVAYGIILGIPAIPKMVKGALGVKDLQDYTAAAVGGAMGGYGVGKTLYDAGTSGIKRDKEAYYKKKADQNANPGTDLGWRKFIPT